MTTSGFTKHLIYQSMLGAIALAATISISDSAQAMSCPVTIDCPPWDTNLFVSPPIIFNTSSPISDPWDQLACPAVRIICRPGDTFMPGSSQWNPILPNRTEREWFIFENVPSNRFVDPPTTYGFQYVMTSGSLFTQILNFPIGIDGDNLFGVSVGNTKLGQFSPGDSVDFVALLGDGVSEFTITGINSPIDPNNPIAFPVQLAFNT